MIFFDMDGVIADFVGGSLRAHRKTLPHAECRWDFMTQVGFTGGGDPAFWEPLSNREFWAGLDPMSDWLELFGLAVERWGAGRVAILSSGLCPGSVDGKRDWLKRHLPGFDVKQAVFATRKGLVAGPGKVLVDDHDANVDEFIAAGGEATIVPRPWNRLTRWTGVGGRFDVGARFGCLVSAAARAGIAESRATPDPADVIAGTTGPAPDAPTVVGG